MEAVLPLKIRPEGRGANLASAAMLCHSLAHFWRDAAPLALTVICPADELTTSRAALAATSPNIKLRFVSDLDVVPELRMNPGLPPPAGAGLAKVEAAQPGAAWAVAVGRCWCRVGRLEPAAGRAARLVLALVQAPVLARVPVWVQALAQGWPRRWQCRRNRGYFGAYAADRAGVQKHEITDQWMHR